MSILNPIVLQAFVDELVKISAVSAPSIKAPPLPGGQGMRITAKPALPTTPKKLIGNALAATTLHKTNYTSVGTKAPKLDITQGLAQKAIPPSAVRS